MLLIKSTSLVYIAICTDPVYTTYNEVYPLLGECNYKEEEITRGEENEHTQLAVILSNWFTCVCWFIS